MFLGLIGVLICVPAAFGQLFLGPCPKPPRHLVNLDLKKYSGEWHVAATTAGNEDDLTCSKVSYNYDKDGNSLRVTYHGNSPFISGSKSGRLQPKKSGSDGEFQLVLDGFPRIWHAYILHTDYDDVAVEYRCLSGVFRSLQEAVVLSRRTPAADVDELRRNFRLDEVMPREFLEKLAPVNQLHC